MDFKRRDLHRLVHQGIQFSCFSPLQFSLELQKTSSDHFAKPHGLVSQRPLPQAPPLGLCFATAFRAVDLLTPLIYIYMYIYCITFFYFMIYITYHIILYPVILYCIAYICFNRSQFSTRFGCLPYLEEAVDHFSKVGEREGVWPWHSLRCT